MGQSLFHEFPNWDEQDDWNNCNINSITVNSNVHELKNFNKVYNNNNRCSLVLILGFIFLCWFLSFEVVIGMIYLLKISEPLGLSIYFFVASIIFLFDFYIICRFIIFNTRNEEVNRYKNIFNKSLNKKLLNNDKYNYKNYRDMNELNFKDKSFNERKIQLIDFLLSSREDINVGLITIIATVLSTIFLLFGSFVGDIVEKEIIQPSFEYNRSGITAYEIYDSRTYDSDINTGNIKSKYKIVEDENKERRYLSITTKLWFLIYIIRILLLIYIFYKKIYIKHRYYEILKSIKYDLI